MRSQQNNQTKTNNSSSTNTTTSHLENRESERIDPASQTPPLSNDTTTHLNPESKSEPMTQVQADSVLTREQLPNVWFRIIVSAVTIGSLLFVFGLYYGIINL